MGLDATPGERFAPREAHVLLTAESITSDGFVDLRDEYRTRAWRSFSKAARAIAARPWLACELGAAGAVCALAVARWLGRRSRGWSALVALDLLLFSGVLFLTLHDRLYGGLTPYASSRAPGGATGLHSLGDLASRAPRLVGVLVDRDAGLLPWAPFAAL